MRKQQPTRSRPRHFADLLLIALSAAIIHLLCGLAAAELSPDDLAAISETGLIPLTGEQEGEYPGKDYVVVETMRVDSGQTVSFAPGSRLFFHDNAKITINGTLTCEGTSAKPVTIGKLPFKLPKLSSSYTNKRNDSTTISVDRGGFISFSHTHLADSTVRIGLTEISSAFTFDSVITSGNWFSLPDTTNFFPQGAVVTCSNATYELYQPCQPILQIVPKLAPDNPEKKPIVISPMVPLRITIGAVVIGAGGAWYYYNRAAQRANDSWKRENVLAAKSAAAGKLPDNTGAIKQYRRENNKAALFRDIASVVGGLGLAGFTMTFLIGGHGR